MSILKEKLNSRQGASLMIALLFFLLCITTGTVILTAATASTGRIRSQKQVQQDYLTVSSAARLVREQLEGTTFNSKTVTTDDEPKEQTYQSSNKFLSETVKADAISVFESSETPERKFTIKVDSDKIESDLKPVDAVFQMDSNYNIKVSFYIKDQGGAKSSPLVLTGTAQTEEYIDIDTWDEEDGNDPVTVIQHETMTKTLTVSWEDFIISNEEASE